MNIFLYCIMCLIYGSTFLAIKLGLNSGFEPFFFGFLRFFSAGIVLMIILMMNKEKLFYTFKEYKRMAIVGFFMTTMCFGAMNVAEQVISSGLAALMIATTPFMIILINYFLKGEKVNSEKILGFIIALSGLSLTVKSSLTDNFSVTWLAHVFIMLIGIFGFAYGSIVAKKAIDEGLKPLVINSYQMLFGSIGLLILSIIFGENFIITKSISGVSALLYLIIGGSVVANSIYQYLMKKLNNFFPSTWTYISPIISLVVGYFVLGESLTVIKFTGGVIVILGVIISRLNLFHRRKKSRIYN